MTQHVPPDSQAIADWYNRRYIEKQEKSFGRPPEESAERLRKFTLRPNALILDVGCGQGFFLHAAREAGHRAIGIDIAYEGIRVARVISPHTRALVASGQQLPFPPRRFDAITCWGTLEHHPDMAQALAEFRRTIAPQGLAVFRVPNRNLWIYRLMALFGRRVGTEQADMVEHLLTYDEWVALFQKAKFKVVRVVPDDWFLRQGFERRMGFKENLKLALRKFVLAVAPLKWTYSFDFICEPDNR